MIRHTELGITEGDQLRKIRKLIKNGNILLAGNCKLKIYGRLDCGSGKRMKPETRVFFKDNTEAKDYGYRPCGHCMPEYYHEWKQKKQN